MRNALFAGLLVLAAAGSVPAAPAIPINAELERLAGQGYRPAGGAKARLRQGELWAAVFKRDDGTQRLYVYLHDAKSVHTLHIELGGSQRIELDGIHAEGVLPDLEKDGSRIIAYRVVMPALDQETLIILRYAKGSLEKTGRVPGGRFQDLDGDGHPEIVGRERPLGALFTIGCESFHTMAQSAWRVSAQSLRGGTLVKTSKEQRAFFERRIADTRGRLSAIDARATQDYGGFLGATLSVYFDYAEMGRGREGWHEFRALYPVKASDPGPVKKCFQDMEAQLRRRLNIPEDW